MVNKSKKILSEISAGELLDKISILEIKLAKVKNKESHIEIDKEYKILKEVEKLNFLIIFLNLKRYKIFHLGYLLSIRTPSIYGHVPKSSI